jgi:WD40 repeat protein
MATSLGDGTVALIGLRSKRLIARLPAKNGGQGEGLAFTSDGRRLATGGIARTVTIWDVRSQAVVRRLRFSDPVAAVAVSPDGRLLAVQQQADKRRDARVEVRDLGSGRTVFTHRLRFGIGDLAFTHDGRALVASACCRGGSSVVGWDAHSGARLFESPVGDGAGTFALSSDSRMMAAGTEDGHVMLWDLHSGRQRGPAIKVAGATVPQLALSPDGRLLAVGAFDATVTVWDVRSRTRVGEAFPVAKGLIPQGRSSPAADC